MPKQPTGGPAFPRAAFAPTNVGYEDVGIHDSQEGMSLRDWFAGQALAGLLARPDFTLFPNDGAEVAARLATENAYAIADAMLSASVEDKP